MPVRRRPARKKTPNKAGASRTRYHHGNLREALIEATLELIEKSGSERVTVRDAARRAGVSSAAPFRHFPNREALIAAVAVEAQRRFREEIAKALDSLTTDDPIARFRAFGIAYVTWAIKNPTYFRVISTKEIFDYDRDENLRRDNDEIVEQFDAILQEAQQRGRLRSDDLTLIKLGGRALVYGLARMVIDGHFPRWGVPESEATHLAERVIDMFVAGLARPA